MELIGYLAAVLIGISLGLIGGGGSILMVPILVYIFGINPVIATSYSLFIVGLAALVGAYNNYRKGLVSIKTAILFGFSSILTVFLTRKLLMPAVPALIFLNSNFSISQSKATMIVFAVLMFLASLAMIGRQKTLVTNQVHSQKSLNYLQILAYGVFIGLVTGFLGAGGGFLIIPFLVLVFKMPMKQAVGTSLLIIALNSLIGFTGDLGRFKLDWLFLLIITLTAILGIFIGGALSKKIDGNQLKKAFGWFVLVFAIAIIMKELFFLIEK